MEITLTTLTYTFCVATLFMIAILALLPGRKPFTRFESFLIGWTWCGCLGLIVYLAANN